MILFVLIMMAVVPALVYGLHALLVLVTKRGTYRLFFWPDYAAIPLAFFVWFVLDFFGVADIKTFVNVLLEPLRASLIWSAVILIRSLVNIITQRMPTRMESYLSAAVLLVAMVLLYIFTPCMPE